MGETVGMEMDALNVEKISRAEAVWDRIAAIKPSLCNHVQIHRHYYRGELWYVQQNHLTGKFSRLSPLAFYLKGKMNGKRNVDEIWQKANDYFEEEAINKDEMIRFVNQLYLSDEIICDTPPDTKNLLTRYNRIEQNLLKQKLMSPLSIKIPLWDPEGFLNRTAKYAIPFYSWFGFLIWTVVVGFAFVVAIQQWEALTDNLFDRILSAHNLLIIWFIFPFLKLFHELGHAYAVKRWGGEVHEIGIMFLVFMPIPYVDASSSSAFREKYKRMVVGLSGILAELFIAAFALFVWMNVDGGLIKAIAYNIVMIASVSTLLFNANPLLRYDGYYVLSDLLEIPNLAQRGIGYIGYLINAYVFGVKNLVAFDVPLGERCWYVGYTVASFLYRIVVYVGIILFVSKKFFFVGILLAIWGIIMMFVMPLYKKVHYLLFNPILKERRIRALGITGVVVLLIGGFIFFVPFSSWTNTEGIVWIDNDSMVRAEMDGFITAINKNHLEIVDQGEPLVQCDNPALEAEIHVRAARLEELRSRYEAVNHEKLVDALIIKEEIILVETELKRLKDKYNKLTISSKREGKFLLPRSEDLLNRYVKQGDLIGYIVGKKYAHIRIVVAQDIADLVRSQSRNIQVKLSDDLDLTYDATLVREVPGAMDHLPSPVLGMQGGGGIAVDPMEQTGLKTFQKLFQFELLLDKSIDTVYIGSRVFIRIEHDPIPLANQWYRKIRQLFLKHYNV